MTAARFEELYRRLAPMVRARARRIIGTEADDVVQETFMRLMRAAPADSQLTSWLYTTATNLCLDRLRHGARRQEDWQREVASQVSAPASAESVLGSREQCRQLLAGLEPRTQLVAVLTHFDELTQDEIAELLGLSRRTIAEELRRLREAAARIAA